MELNIILEGTDGVGKSSTIKELAKENIICQDRSKDIISKYMMFDIEMDYRAKKYYEYLKSNNVLILFLINNDKDELMKRIFNRKIISTFDLEAYEYNKLYYATYNYMKEKGMLLNKLFLIDVTGLTLHEQVEKVKEVIYAINSSTFSSIKISQ